MMKNQVKLGSVSRLPVHKHRKQIQAPGHYSPGEADTSTSMSGYRTYVNIPIMIHTLSTTQRKQGGKEQ
jgi:hypothetical protein